MFPYNSNSKLVQLN